MVDLRQLRYFVAVAEEAHFGRAAARLHMAQPPLSQAIRQLEAELGVELLHRTTRKVELSQAGRAYLDRARDLLAGVDDAGDLARRVAAGSVGHLTIGCVGSATYSHLPSLSRALALELPGVDFAFRGEMLVPEQVQALAAGQIDIALLRPPIARPEIVVRPLRRDRLVVALPADDPLAAKTQVRVHDLADRPLIVHSAGRRSVMYDVVQRLLRDAGVTPIVRHEVGETSTLVTLVAGGLGAAIVPETVSALALDGVVYRRLVRPVTSVELALAHRADRGEPHLARSVEVIRRLLGTGRQAADTRRDRRVTPSTPVQPHPRPDRPADKERP